MELCSGVEFLQKSDISQWSCGSQGITWWSDRGPTSVYGPAEVKPLLGGPAEVQHLSMVRRKSGLHLVVRRRSIGGTAEVRASLGGQAEVRRQSVVRWKSGRHLVVRRRSDVSRWSGGSQGVTWWSGGGPTSVGWEWFGWTADVDSLDRGPFTGYLTVLVMSEFNGLRLVGFVSSSRSIRL
ncbi:hypothetical protein M5K25_010570 [Dendrobium thyrsiflorum]|uniref:Uncharacterized protein n=1 Tax=Dendrobium thyrsiflorum TaxID=117978 RepID=A0ABD0V0Z4_DENTH